MIRNIVLAVAVLCAANSYAQRAVRATVTHAVSDIEGAVTASYRFSDYAQMGEGAFSIAWISIDAATNINVDVIAADGSYTNALIAIELTEATTTNLSYFTETTLGEWPPYDQLVFTTCTTNDAFAVRMLLRATK